MGADALNSEMATERQAVSVWLPLAGLLTLLVLSEAVYLLLLQLNAVNGWGPVSIFWLEMAALFVLYGLAAILVNRCLRIRKQAVWIIIFGAVLFRLTLLPAGIPYELSPSEKFEAMQADLAGTEAAYDRFQLFDNDIWRYIWDGHVWAHGINPYTYTPDDERLDALTAEADEAGSDEELLTEIGDNSSVGETKAVSSIKNIPNQDLTDGRTVWADIRDNVNHAHITTIYPPLAQIVFRLSHAIAPGSLLMMKLVLIGCELVGIFFLMLTLRRLDMPVTSVILYAWNPLMIKVFAGSGHADAILMSALCVTTYFIVLGSRSLAAGAFGLAILAKLSPVILLPFVVRRVGWWRSLIIAVVVLAGYLPFLSAGQNLFAGFFTFAREWQFNAGVFALVRWGLESFSDDPASLTRPICAGLIVAVVAVLVWRDDLSEKSFVRSAAIAIGAIIVLSPTVMPWYLSWVLPFAVLARQYVWIYFSVIVLAAFHVLIDVNEYAAVLWFEHGLLFVLVLRQAWLDRRVVKTTFEQGLISEFSPKHTI